MEDWLEIEDFPGYEVSSHGRIRNADTGRLLGIYDNGHGVRQVVLRRGGRNVARAVNRLVAHAFLHPGPEDCVPIHIDQDRNNCAADNLEWKPRWFAIQRTRQSNRTEPRDRRRVMHEKSGVVYANALECAKDIGGLEHLVLLTAQSRHETTYLGSTYRFVY